VRTWGLERGLEEVTGIKEEEGNMVPGLCTGLWTAVALSFHFFLLTLEGQQTSPDSVASCGLTVEATWWPPWRRSLAAEGEEVVPAGQSCCSHLLAGLPRQPQSPMQERRQLLTLGREIRTFPLRAIPMGIWENNQEPRNMAP
jgi:hypothetical protein